MQSSLFHPMHCYNLFVQRDGYTLYAQDSVNAYWSDVFTFQTGNNNTASRLEKNGNTAFQYDWYYGGFVSGTVLFNHTGVKYDFISLVFDDTNATCYQNAVQTVQTASSDFGSASDIHLSKRLNMNALWSGNIAQFSIYNKPLTALEVKQNYDALKWRYG